MTSDVLVDTPAAAYAVDMTVPRFHGWARRRGLAPVSHVRKGRRTLALWRLADVYAATVAHTGNGGRALPDLCRKVNANG